jgi:hypothetical protein
MAHRICVVVIALGAAAIMSAAPTAAQRSGQDTLRRPTPEEYQAMRRQWLAARRAGMAVPPPIAYGSAVVGARSPGDASGVVLPGGMGVPGMAPQVVAGGRVELLCEGWIEPLGPGPGLTRRPSAHEREPVGSGSGIADAVRSTDPRGRSAAFDGTCTPYGYPSYGPGLPGGYGYGPAGYGPGGPGYGPGGPGYGPGGPGYGPGGPGYGPGGYGPGGPGYGYGPGVTGYGSGVPGGYGPGGYDPLNPAVPGWSGWTGVTEYMWGPWGPVPLYPYGWQSTPGSGYGFSWPGTGAGECALVTITTAGGVVQSIAVGVQPLGLGDLADLDLALDLRLSQGQAVTLLGIDGRVLRLTPGPGIEDIRVTPCAGR